MDSIILVEDDEKLSSLICQYLVKQSFDVEVINHGDLAVEAILTRQPALVILDLMLPGKDGLTICREIRSQYKGNILFLTASEDDMDHVAGVELGADDFIIKPIQPRVLLARIRMLLRRSHSIIHSTLNSNVSSLAESVKQGIPSADTQENPKLANTRQLRFGQLVINNAKRSVSFNDSIVPLTTGEFDLLWLLANHPEEILSRDVIYQELRGIEYDGMDRAMDTKIGNLRKKLGDNASLSTRIITVRGQGYLFVPDSWG